MSKRFHYISPSLLPSRTANSIHVINQCYALSNKGFEVFLYAKRSVIGINELKKNITKIYGISSPKLKYITYFSKLNFFDNLCIAIMAVRHCFFSSQDYLLSRNLYAAFIFAVIFRRSILYETHQLEFGVRKFIQRFIIMSPQVKTIFISKILVKVLSEHHDLKIKNPLVLHDAAISGIMPVPYTMKRNLLSRDLNEDISSWKQVIGYFGHLFAGRGIEIIEKVANAMPDCLFLVYGGNDEHILFHRDKVRLKNLRFMGYITHRQSQHTMKLVDILLMPYQYKVSIGVDLHDTARWMSPMKMFEYMASGVPFISSNLPVLREVLTNEVNCLLVEPDNKDAWINGILRLMNEPKFAKKIAFQAHVDYQKYYTWSHRADCLINAAKKL
jgi:glycosyltransferase involved in cell wall biosynthesis